MVTIIASGLDALGTYRPPATGAARCRWGEWSRDDPPEAAANYRETAATLVSSTELVCSTLPQSGTSTDVLSLAINGQQFVKTLLNLQYYTQPGMLITPNHTCKSANCILKNLAENKRTFLSCRLG